MKIRVLCNFLVKRMAATARHGARLSRRRSLAVSLRGDVPGTSCGDVSRWIGRPSPQTISLLPAKRQPHPRQLTDTIVTLTSLPSSGWASAALHFAVHSKHTEKNIPLKTEVQRNLQGITTLDKVEKAVKTDQVTKKLASSGS